MISSNLAGNCRGLLDDVGRPQNHEACVHTVARGSTVRSKGYRTRELLACLAWVSGRGKETVSHGALAALAHSRLAPHPVTYIRHFGSLKKAVEEMEKVSAARRGTRSGTTRGPSPRLVRKKAGRR